MFPLRLILILTLALVVSSFPLQEENSPKRKYEDGPRRCVYTTDSTKSRMNIDMCLKSCRDLVPEAILLEKLTYKPIYLYCDVPSSTISVKKGNVYKSETVD